MKCWECKKKTGKARKVNYTDGVKERTRDVCQRCESILLYNPCHFVEVDRISQRQLRL